VSGKAEKFWAERLGRQEGRKAEKFWAERLRRKKEEGRRMKDEG
jgi:hypothetical protein